jgi:pyruvate carboxylase
VRLFAGLEAISEPDERGLRTVMCRLNGQLRPIQIRDRAVGSTVPTTEKADPRAPGQVAAPFGGVVTLAVAEGDSVEPGQTVATIEAMKMEASITTPVGGVVQRVALSSVAQVEGGDLLLVVA